MAANKKQTSAKVAKQASSFLRNPKSPAASKAVAGSALSQKGKAGRK
jgi:hypothetical protein